MQSDGLRLICTAQAPPSLADSAASIADSTEQQHSLRVDEPLDDGFQPAGRKGASRGASRAGRSASTAADAGGAALTEAEAADLLKHAAQSVTGDERPRLWQEWQRQVS